MVYEYTCTICGEAGHTVGRCDELWQNKVPPPERGQGGDEEDAINLLVLKNKKPRWVFVFFGATDNMLNPALIHELCVTCV